MPRFQPMTIAQRIQQKKKRKKSVIMPDIPPSKRAEVLYRKDMNKLITAMSKDVLTTIVPFLKMNSTAFVADVSFSLQLRDLLHGIKKKYRDITGLATGMATKAIGTMAADNKKRFDTAIEKATGVSLGRIISNENLADTLQTQIAVNVDLIQSLPDEYYKKISTRIFQRVAQGDKVGSLTFDLMQIAGVTRKRANLIARDQTSKTNAAISRQRQEALGITEYVWRTSQDERVRTSHKNNNGEVFRWDKPSKITGHPGRDINCRCTARGIINLD